LWLRRLDGLARVTPILVFPIGFMRLEVSPGRDVGIAGKWLGASPSI
jgi:hypothetical protein